MLTWNHGFSNGVGANGRYQLFQLHLQSYTYSLMNRLMRMTTYVTVMTTIL